MLKPATFLIGRSIEIKTADRILDVTQELIQTKGYSAISFNHIADLVGIKKPSIVHHYPSKAALGQAVVRRYKTQFSEALERCVADPKYSSLHAFQFYCQPYLSLSEDGGKVCLCGALAGELLALPGVMQEEVKRFFASHLQWLELVLVAGLNRGEFCFSESASEMAGLILNSLQGALMVQRSTEDKTHIQNTVELLRLRIVGVM